MVTYAQIVACPPLNCSAAPAAATSEEAATASCGLAILARLTRSMKRLRPSLPGDSAALSQLDRADSTLPSTPPEPPSMEAQQCPRLPDDTPEEAGPPSTRACSGPAGNMPVNLPVSPVLDETPARDESLLSAQANPLPPPPGLETLPTYMEQVICKFCLVKRGATEDSDLVKIVAHICSTIIMLVLYPVIKGVKQKYPQYISLVARHNYW